jgi:hypothetical protein
MFQIVDGAASAVLRAIDDGSAQLIVEAHREGSDYSVDLYALNGGIVRCEHFTGDEDPRLDKLSGAEVAEIKDAYHLD